MRKILYIANIRMPTEKAHGVQIIKTCEALAKQSMLKGLIVSNRRTQIIESPFEYYGVETRFPLIRVPVVDSVSLGKFGFLLETLTFAKAVQREVWNHTDIVLYGRDEHVLRWLLNTGKPVVWESHTGAWNPSARIVARYATRLIVISEGLKEFYVAKGIPPEKIFVAHDGIDLAAFAHPESRETARARLGVPTDLQLALYIGRVDGWKGTDTLVEAAAFLPEGIRIGIIGGEPEQMDKLRPHYPHVLFLGSRPYAELPDNQQAADVLVLPTTAKNEIGARFTSPLKLFSYMASGVPIVATDVPSTREVLDDSCAYFAKADDSQSLASVILTALSDAGRAQKATAAKEKVRAYTWDERASRIQEALTDI